MEEADALADRILIIHRGKLCINEKSNKLKEIYGNGYKLIFRIDSNQNENHRNHLKIWLKENFPSGFIENETNEQILFQTNEQISKEFLDKLIQLDLMKEEQIFLSFGIAQTTLGFLLLLLLRREEER